MKKYIISLFVLGLIVINGFVYAEETTQTENQEPPKPALFREQQKEKVQNAKKEREETRVELKNEREEFKNRLEEKRQEMKTNILANRDALKIKLQKIKSVAKQNSVLIISDNIEKINSNTTNRFNNLVDQIEKILNNIKIRVEEKSQKGIDISAVTLAIENAKNKITEVRVAINEQGTKSYILEVTDETTLKTKIKSTRDSFHSDLKVVQEKIKIVHEAVRTAAKELGKLSVDNSVVEENTTENNVE